MWPKTATPGTSAPVKPNCAATSSLCMRFSVASEKLRAVDVRIDKAGSPSCFVENGY